MPTRTDKNREEVAIISVGESITTTGRKSGTGAWSWVEVRYKDQTGWLLDPMRYSGWSRVYSH